jgi:hypothetical protein
MRVQNFTELEVIEDFVPLLLRFAVPRRICSMRKFASGTDSFLWFIAEMIVAALTRIRIRPDVCVQTPLDFLIRDDALELPQRSAESQRSLPGASGSPSQVALMKDEMSA